MTREPQRDPDVVDKIDPFGMNPVMLNQRISRIVRRRRDQRTFDSSLVEDGLNLCDGIARLRILAIVKMRVVDRSGVRAR